MPKDLKKQHEIFLEWHPLTEDEREARGWPITLKAMAAYLGMSYDQLRTWNRVVKKADSLDARIKAVDDRSYKKAVADKSTPRDREVFYKRRGLLVDKSEQKVEHSFGPSDYIEIARRIWEDIEGRIPEQCRGSCPLLSGRSLLLGEVCVHPEQEHGEEDKVAGVGLPA